MKANAPEKIYVDANENWLKIYTAFTEKAKGNDIEYTRTDAFIEKAANWISEHTSLSEKLVIENFKKYMLCQ